jgi:2-succinyl-6-hydroxy-2,4-cyclohexadiene-1-carboxylate synthase
MWEILSQYYYCIAFDLPGHGRSPDITLDYLYEIQKAIAEAVDAPPTLIGYSLGGRIALQLAKAHPSFYSHVIILSAHPGIAEEKERQARVAHDQMWIEKLKNFSLEDFLNEWYNQPLFQSLHERPELLNNILKKRSSQDPRRLADAMQLLSLGKMSPIASFHPRTLFLYGEKDARFRALYASFADEICVEEIHNSGHVVHLENPKRCVEIILQWRKR